MAKKKKPAKKKDSKGVNAAAVKAKMRTARNARAQVLPDPSFEQVRDKKMDGWLASVAEIRRNRALGVEDEAGLSQLMLAHMRAKGYVTCTGDGITVNRVPGKAEHLQIALIKDRTAQATVKASKPLDHVDEEVALTDEELQEQTDAATTH